MQPLEKLDTLNNKLLKKCKIDVREASHHIVEGDVVILTTFFLTILHQTHVEGANFLAGEFY